MTRDLREPLTEPGQELTAVGPTYTVVRRCHSCALTQQPRRGLHTAGPATPTGLESLAEQRGSSRALGTGSLSPSGTFVSFAGVDADFHSRMWVTNLTSGETTLILGTLTPINPNDQSAWLHDRWVLTVTDNTLRVFDTRTGTL